MARLYNSFFAFWASKEDFENNYPDLLSSHGEPWAVGMRHNGDNMDRGRFQVTI
ncbi:hypothetical protein M413DRAFT_442789 [Hebeloma cylindrosporum]|uniref:Uncharacterized protein n=1 Tax=Hebeloma cylindrosporum TaxID=76867 RepID=A0A0C2YUY2_HEBCY|nr:hypothetical protein M413DRAFT_442789 [Hebeloma cylindrosporum h7]